jgi:succinyl-CoA synthetase beta subunit
MELHEFKAKRLLTRYRIACPNGRVAVTPDEAQHAAEELGQGIVYVKAQIYAGDRAKAGGVRAAKSPADAKEIAKELLDSKLITSQTNAGGLTVKYVLVEAAVEDGREFYLAMTVDPLSGSIRVTAGPGGTGVEDTVAQNSALLKHLYLSLKGERNAGELQKFSNDLGFSAQAAELFCNIVLKLHRAFIELDASLIEINPLILTRSKEFIAADAKIILDDNAMFRHPDLAELREDDEIDEVELRAQKHQINFVQIGGDIGVVVNGAGLGLATLDLLHAVGGSPANFMDIRTTAKSLDIAQGIGLLLDNPNVRVLFVNVFGGGMQPCDTIIEGLGIAFRRKSRAIPIVLRVTGNNEELAKLRLKSFGLPEIHGTDMWQAATRAAAIAQGKA